MKDDDENVDEGTMVAARSCLAAGLRRDLERDIVLAVMEEKGCNGEREETAGGRKTITRPRHHCVLHAPRRVRVIYIALLYHHAYSTMADSVSSAPVHLRGLTRLCFSQDGE